MNLKLERINRGILFNKKTQNELFLVNYRLLYILIIKISKTISCYYGFNLIKLNKLEAVLKNSMGILIYYEKLN